jgi:hypothetical protein
MVLRFRLRYRYSVPLLKRKSLLSQAQLRLDLRQLDRFLFDESFLSKLGHFVFLMTLRAQVVWISYFEGRVSVAVRILTVV